MKAVVVMLTALALGVFGCEPDDGDDRTIPDAGVGGDGGDDGSGNGGTGGSDGCAAPAFDIAGTYNERYNCREIRTQICAGTDVATTVTISGDISSGEYTLENTVDATEGAGRLCGNVFEWVSRGEGDFTEMGEWTFTDERNVTIETTFERGDGVTGECVAVATRDPASPGPPPDLACTPLL